MSKFKSLPSIVEAIQYDITQDVSIYEDWFTNNTQNMPNVSGLFDDSQVKATEPGTQGLRVQCKSGWNLAKDQDWLIIEQDQTGLYPVNPEIFQKKYAPYAGEDQLVKG